MLVVPLDHVRHPQMNEYAIRWISSTPCSTGAPERPGSRRPSAIAPTGAVGAAARRAPCRHGPGRPTKRIRQRRPRSRPRRGVARPPPATHRVSDVLRLRPDRKVIRADTAPHVAAVPHHRLRQDSVVRQRRPAPRRRQDRPAEGVAGQSGNRSGWGDSDQRKFSVRSGEERVAGACVEGFAPDAGRALQEVPRGIADRGGLRADRADRDGVVRLHVLFHVVTLGERGPGRVSTAYSIDIGWHRCMPATPEV